MNFTQQQNCIFSWLVLQGTLVGKADIVFPRCLLQQVLQHPQWPWEGASFAGPLVSVLWLVACQHTSIFILTQSNVLYYTQHPQLEFYFLLYLQKAQMNVEHSDSNCKHQRQFYHTACYLLMCNQCKNVIWGRWIAYLSLTHNFRNIGC